MAKERKDRRVDFMMSPSEVAAVDEWRATQEGVPGRSEALRRLVKRGLAATSHDAFIRECRTYVEMVYPERRHEVEQIVPELLAHADEIIGSCGQLRPTSLRSLTAR
jgi:metal-responsive CopG/Arc/MetJ family transcriptional regulator